MSPFQGRLALYADLIVDGLDGVEEVLEGAEIPVLLSDLACCHVPVLKLGFPAAPDGEHGDEAIVFERHPGAGPGSSVLGRRLDDTRDSAGLQAFLMLGEPGLEPLRQFDRDGLPFFALPHGWAMNPADRSSWKGNPALVHSQPRSRTSRLPAATWAGRMGTASAPTQILERA
ncbi:hypothetical protein [Streptomyces griseochromogenes]|uniref:hypothetical protein n=1 Tax=Streptomyces griseochromogenes TaxID=68214 RepID=UPI0037B97DCF